MPPVLCRSTHRWWARAVDSEYVFDIYFFGRRTNLFYAPLESLIMKFCTENDKLQISEDSLFEAYQDSVALAQTDPIKHEEFIDFIFPFIYESRYYGEALTEALESKDTTFLKRAAIKRVAEVEDEEDLEMIMDAVQLAISAGYEADVFLTQYAPELKGNLDMLAQLAPVRNLAAELKEKIQNALGIQFPDKVIFSQFEGTYAKIKYELEEENYADRTKHAVGATA